ncbi:hypothetical protein GOP47_0030337 [Adiantum capillus-veneris]|nr:hypothetical protein GOP47_0030337 [Adiantum capillus-veneris]
MSGICKTFYQSSGRVAAIDSLGHVNNRSLKLLGLEEALHCAEEGTSHPSIDELSCFLHLCRKSKDQSCGARLHAYLCKNNLDDHRLLGNYLISTLVAVGLTHNAQQVFDKLPNRDEWSWYSLITGYIQCAKPHLAFGLYEKMQDECLVHPSGHMIVALLKACAKLKDLKRGLAIHAHIARTGVLERDLFVGSTLVDMYGKCGSLVMAQNIFDRLKTRNVVSWNALMTGYVDNGDCEAAVKCFEQMKHERVAPDAFTFVCMLKACGNMKYIQKIQALHVEIEKLGLLETDAFVNNTLVDVYANCGSLTKAEQVFDKLVVHNVVSWNTLMAAYAKHGQYAEAIMCFEQMQLEGVTPDALSFACSLRACGSTKSVQKGQVIHEVIQKTKHLASDPVIGNALVDMYINCGLLGSARAVLDSLSQRDVAAWTAIIAKCVEDGCSKDALDCFERMQSESVFPNVITFVYTLKACSSLRAISEGQKIHAEIERKGLLENNVFIASILVDMYANCGVLSKAQEVFDRISVQDVILWNALINGYADHSYGVEALAYFECLESEDIYPNAVTFVGGLKACGCISATDKLHDMHVEIERLSLLEADLVVGTALVDAYAKCGLLSKAQQLFDKLPDKNVISWNALITGYAENGCGTLALKCYKQMQLEGVAPDVFTLVSIMKVGSQNLDLELHSEVARRGDLRRDSVAGNALIDMYVRRGLLARAQEVFDKLPLRDIVSWNVLISGYSGRYGEEALKIFEQMQLQGFSPNRISLVCSLKACASIGSIEKGKEVHTEIVKKGYMDTELVGNALIDMYAKCGHLAMAQHVFDKLNIHDTVSCNSLIAGYSQLGETQTVFQIFDRMQREEINPNSITFIVVLNACGCIGLYDKSQMYYEAMVSEFGILPTLQHHACMVDLLGRVGKLDIANALAYKLPVCPNPVVLRTMLGASRCWGNVDLGKRAFDHAISLDKKMQ